MTRLTIYTRRQCHLCDEMKVVVRGAARAWAFTVDEVNVDGDPALVARYGWDVPVLALDGHEVARHRITPDALEALLAARGAGRQPG